MNQERLKTILNAYGADPARWPEDERQAALDLLDAHPEIHQAALDDEKDLDQLLDQLRDDRAVSETLQQRLEQSLPASSTADRAPSGLPTWAGIAAALALTAGLSLGWLGADLLPDPTASDLDVEYYADAFSALNSDSAWQLEDTQ